jgi:hypothetical protein
MFSVEVRLTPSTVPTDWLVPAMLVTPPSLSIATRLSGTVTSEATVISVGTPDPTDAGALVSTTAEKSYAPTSGVVVQW